MFVRVREGRHGHAHERVSLRERPRGTRWQAKRDAQTAKVGQLQKVQKVEGLENLRTLQNELNQAKKLVTPRLMRTCLEPAAARACCNAD